MDIPLSCDPPVTLTVISVYCPSADYTEEDYTQRQYDLEELYSYSTADSNSAIIIAGVFNAHLGTLAGPRGNGTPNSRGVHLKRLIDRNSLFVASHSQLSLGPNYTYHSSSHFTIIITNWLTSEFTICIDHSFNVSDHLALTLTLSLHPSSIFTEVPPLRTDWCKAINYVLVKILSWPTTTGGFPYHLSLFEQVILLRI